MYGRVQLVWSAVMSSALDALAVREGRQRCRNREFRADEKRRGGAVGFYRVKSRCQVNSI
jgi:hypothetical protein